MSRCRNCRRVIHTSEVRPRWYPAGSDGPGFLQDDGGCVRCSPSEEQDDAARDAAAEYRGDLMRDGDAA